MDPSYFMSGPLLGQCQGILIFGPQNFFDFCTHFFSLAAQAEGSPILENQQYPTNFGHLRVDYMVFLPAESESGIRIKCQCTVLKLFFPAIFSDISAHRCNRLIKRNNFCEGNKPKRSFYKKITIGRFPDHNSDFIALPIAPYFRTIPRSHISSLTVIHISPSYLSNQNGI